MNAKKGALRKGARILRSSLDEAYADHASRRACELLISTESFKSADTVLIYFPIKNEISPLPIISEARKMGKDIAFPTCITGNRTLSFKKVNAINALKPMNFGLFEPDSSLPYAEITKNSLCIVPALLFSRKGHRLGYGKGYYDRFLADFPGKSIGFSYSVLLCDDIPTETHDIPLDMIITESEVLYFDKNVT